VENKKKRLTAAGKKAGGDHRGISTSQPLLPLPTIESSD